MAIMRHAKQENNTGAVLTTSSLTDGRDYKSLIIERKFAAADIGTNAGQTRHVDGCLVGTITSGVIYQIVGMTMQSKSPQGQFAIYHLLPGANSGLMVQDKKHIYAYDQGGASIVTGSSLLVHVLIAPA